METSPQTSSAPDWNRNGYVKGLVCLPLTVNTPYNDCTSQWLHLTITAPHSDYTWQWLHLTVTTPVSDCSSHKCGFVTRFAGSYTTRFSQRNNCSREMNKFFVQPVYGYLSGTMRKVNKAPVTLNNLHEALLFVLLVYFIILFSFRRFKILHWC